MLKIKSVSSKKASVRSEKNTAIKISCYCSLLFSSFHFTVQTSSAQRLNNLDNRILVNLSNHRTNGTTHTMQFVSNTTDLVSIGVPASVLLEGLLVKNKLTVKKGAYMLASQAVTIAETYILKEAFNRKRPFEVNPYIVKASSGGSPSFPSGHTSSAFSTATSLTLAFPKWYVIVPAYAWAGTVGFSRMYLGVHYPSDVLAGALLGSASAWVMYKLNRRLQENRHRRLH